MTRTSLSSNVSIGGALDAQMQALLPLGALPPVPLLYHPVPIPISISISMPASPMTPLSQLTHHPGRPPMPNTSPLRAHRRWPAITPSPMIPVVFTYLSAMLPCHAPLAPCCTTPFAPAPSVWTSLRLYLVARFLYHRHCVLPAENVLDVRVRVRREV